MNVKLIRRMMFILSRMRVLELVNLSFKVITVLAAVQSPFTALDILQSDNFYLGVSCDKAECKSLCMKQISPRHQFSLIDNKTKVKI